MMKRYNLFLDDIRFPYLDSKKYNKLSDEFFNVSTYHYTYYEPFKTEKWIIVRNYDEFVSEIIKRGIPYICSFDHDLGKEHLENVSEIDYDKYIEKTGYDCAKWLCSYCQDNSLKFPYYYIHSMNEVGTENIEKYIENYKKHVENI